MEVGFTVRYAKEVVQEDIPSLPKVWRGKIQSDIEQKLTSEPELFGKPLRRSLRGYRRLRVGDYRVVYRIEKRSVLVFAILHRSIVYKEFEKRI